jgi:hypothetical protein
VAPPSAPRLEKVEKVEDPKVRVAREFFMQMRKATKTIGMYRHQSGRFAEMLRPAYVALQAALVEGPIALKVTAESLQVGDQPVLSGDGETLPFRLFREGVRHLVFRPEFTEDELQTLARIWLSSSGTERERGAEELVSQLWNAGFNHLDYVVVEGFSVGDLSEEQVQVQVDNIVQYLFQRLSSEDGLDTLAFARVSESDLDLKLEGIEQIRGVVIEGDSVGDAYRKRLQSELKLDEEKRLPEQLVTLLSEMVVEGRFDGPELPAELLGQLIDTLLLHEDLAPIARALDLLEKLAAQETPGAEQARAVKKSLSTKLGDEFRLRRLGDALKHNRNLDLPGAARYLGLLTATATSTLLDLLDGMEAADRRPLIIETLARVGAGVPELFAARLSSEKSQTVRDMVAIIEKGGFADRNKYLATALNHPNPMVRSEVVTILAASGRPAQAHKFLLDATLDKAPQVRAMAFRGLVQLSPLRAVQDLLRLPKLPEWDKRDAKERELVHECLGLTQTPDALKFLVSTLQQKKTLLGGRKITEAKLHAISGLQAMATLQAYKLLQAIAAENDADLGPAARRAMTVVKKVLFEAPTTTAPQEASAEQKADALYDQFEQASAQGDAERAREKEQLQESIAAREKSEFEATVKAEAEQRAERDRILAAQAAAQQAKLLRRPPTPPPFPTGSTPPARPPPPPPSAEVTEAPTAVKPRPPTPPPPPLTDALTAAKPAAPGQGQSQTTSPRGASSPGITQPRALLQPTPDTSPGKPAPEGVQRPNTGKPPPVPNPGTQPGMTPRAVVPAAAPRPQVTAAVAGGAPVSVTGALPATPRPATPSLASPQPPRPPTPLQSQLTPPRPPTPVSLATPPAPVAQGQRETVAAPPPPPAAAPPRPITQVKAPIPDDDDGGFEWSEP